MFPKGNSYCHMAINLTDNCNTCCRYCFRENSPRGRDFLSANTVIGILEYCAKMADSKKYLQLTGGEIFCHPDIWEIMNIALQLGFYLQLQTNGLCFSSMSDDELRWFSQENVNTKISFDGWDPDTHEVFRAKGSFSVAYDGLKKFVRFSPKFSFKSVINQKTFSCYEKMLDFAIDVRARGISYNFLRPEGFGKSIDLQLDELEFVKHMVPFFNQDKYRHLLNGTSILTTWLMPNPTVDFFQCFYVHCDGNIYPTQDLIAEQLIGNVKNSPEELRPDKITPTTRSVKPEIWEYVKANLKIEGVKTHG